MKQIFKILAGAAVIASSAACSQKIDFETFSYARLEAGAYTFNEDAGTVTVPVFARAKDGSPLSGGSVSFEVVDNTAKAGTDFTVEPAGGSVTLSDGLILHDLCPYLVANGFAHGLEATYDYADNTIHVPALQDIGNVAWFLCLDEEGEDLVDEVVFSYDEAAGTIVNENVYAASPDEDGASGFYDAIPPGVTFTKQ